MFIEPRLEFAVVAEMERGRLRGEERLQRGDDPLFPVGLDRLRFPARGRQVMGTIHATEIFSICCPEISRSTAADIALFCAE